jgi:hypothetical protein
MSLVQDEITKSVDMAAGRLLDLREDMLANAATAERIRQDIRALQNRCEAMLVLRDRPGAPACTARRFCVRYCCGRCVSMLCIRLSFC